MAHEKDFLARAKALEVQANTLINLARDIAKQVQAGLDRGKAAEMLEEPFYSFQNGIDTFLEDADKAGADLEQTDIKVARLHFEIVLEEIVEYREQLLSSLN
jgi:soluble cytochrome b562